METGDDASVYLDSIIVPDDEDEGAAALIWNSDATENTTSGLKHPEQATTNKAGSVISSI